MRRRLVSALSSLGARLLGKKPPRRDIASLCVCGPGCTLHPGGQIYHNIAGLDRITLGSHTHIKGELLTFGHGGRITLGDYCYVGEGTRIWSALSITIGNRVLISHNVNIFDNDTHPIDDPKERHRQFVEIITNCHPQQIDLRERPVVIGDDVLIGCQSIILSGVTIGDGAVVGAGSVVTRDVPPMTLVAGNPARVLRKLEPKS